MDLFAEFLWSVEIEKHRQQTWHQVYLLKVSVLARPLRHIGLYKICFSKTHSFLRPG